MVEIRDQTKITSLENAWKNCGVLNIASKGDSTCLPISDVRNVQYINYAFAVDDDFQGKKSYIDNVATMETVDPSVITDAIGTLQNNQLVGTSTGASGEENRTNLKTMFANNVDLTVDGIPSDEKNGNEIFEKLYDALEGDADTTILRHNHVRYFPYLDGHTTCFTKGQGTTTIGDGNVAAVNTSAITNEFSTGTPNTTGVELLQTEVAFSVIDEDSTKTILSKTINENYSDQVAFGDTQSVGVSGSGNLTGGQSNSVSSGAYTLSWDGIPCTKRDITYGSLSGKSLEIPNNMNFRICHKVTISSGTTYNVQPGAKVEIAPGGSIVVQSGATVTIASDGYIDVKSEATVNVETGGTITNIGTIDNNGTINNNGTIETVTSGITGNSVQGNTPVTIQP